MQGIRGGVGVSRANAAVMVTVIASTWQMSESLRSPCTATFDLESSMSVFRRLEPACMKINMMNSWRNMPDPSGHSAGWVKVDQDQAPHPRCSPALASPSRAGTGQPGPALRTVQTLRKACSRSAIRSCTSSMPTDSRTSPSSRPSVRRTSAGTEAWVRWPDARSGFPPRRGSRPA